MSDETRLDFALLGHPDSYDHLGELILHSRPDYDAAKLEKYKATLSKFFEWTPSYASQTPLEISASDGRTLHGRLIICTFLPENITNPRQMKMAFDKTRQGCQVAVDRGARVAGLGGFTSIVTGTQGDKLQDEFGLAVTSGNSLTAALALAQLDELLDKLGWNLDNRSIAVIGASGDIGRACTLSLAPRARHSLLIARNQAKLARFQAELDPALSTSTSTDLADAAQADVIVAATSASEPILAEADLRPGTLVVDIGYPKNLAYAANPREDVIVISAGLAEMPFDFDIQYYTRLPTPRIMYGCFSEAMVLALSGRNESFSVGQGKITLEKMDTILELAREHGFRPAPLYRGDVPIDDARLARFLSLLNQETA